MDDSCDIAIVGCGAAGLMAATWAGRTPSAGATRDRPRIIAFDGARTLGAKILVAGGGRCNVTHDVVDETAYAGSSRHAIRKVLLQFGVPRTVEFFRDLGVELKREDTGKLFPVTDDARTVLDALVGAARDARVEIRHPARVTAIERTERGFLVRTGGPEAGEAGPAGIVEARRVILCAGGKALPKTGSDGVGYELARSLGHSVTPHVFPALVPLVLERGHWLTALSGLTLDATLELRSASGRKFQAFTGSTLLTHFGLSGPSVLDMSRFWSGAVIEARERGEAPPRLVICVVPGRKPEELDRDLVVLGSRSIARWLGDSCGLSERLGAALCAHARVDARAVGAVVTREQRLRLIGALTQLDVPISGDRGFTYAEATAGGVPLSEVRLETMESRMCPGLHLCGEILDVDGRIGGYNFQWAWASGHVAGVGAARALTGT